MVVPILTRQQSRSTEGLAIPATQSKEKGMVQRDRKQTITFAGRVVPYWRKSSKRAEWLGVLLC